MQSVKDPLRESESGKGPFTDTRSIVQARTAQELAPPTRRITRASTPDTISQNTAAMP